jgi:GTP cyclohydrolase II/3,4-dihydroxy 2-butanone 4-phosphate synthase/GTP cyclohydrolase II
MPEQPTIPAPPLLYADAPLPTRRGPFRMMVFREAVGTEQVALVKGDVAGREGVIARVHSECLTAEVLGSLKCDCREQLEAALDAIAAADAGVLVYLRQEGRGIGLGNKIRAYALQAAGLDTYEANRHLGFEEDLRSYETAAAILRHLRVASVDLITNNPLKVKGLEDGGIPVRRRIPSIVAANAYNAGYLEAKRDIGGHLLDVLVRPNKVG